MQKKVRWLPDETRLILVIVVSAFLIIVAGPSWKVLIGIAVMYAVAVVTTNLRPIKSRRRR